MPGISIMTFNILSILPVLVLAGFGMIVLMMDVFSSRKMGEKNFLAYLSLIGVVIAAIVLYN